MHQHATRSAALQAAHLPAAGHAAGSQPGLLLQQVCKSKPLCSLSHAPIAAPSPRRPQDDYRFGLLWEWNLYDAMLYSPYVAARLQTYTGAPAAPQGPAEPDGQEGMVAERWWPPG